MFWSKKDKKIKLTRDIKEDLKTTIKLGKLIDTSFYQRGSGKTKALEEIALKSKGKIKVVKPNKSVVNSLNRNCKEKVFVTIDMINVNNDKILLDEGLSKQQLDLIFDKFRNLVVGGFVDKFNGNKFALNKEVVW